MNKRECKVKKNDMMKNVVKMCGAREEGN